MDGIAEHGLIGVDGGGTHCRFALMRDGNRVDVRVGGANVHSDQVAAIQTLNDGLAALAQKAGLTIADLSPYPAYLGLAGVLSPEKANAVALHLPLANAVVDDDRKTAVVGALGDGDGTILGIGTGSFFARQTGGTVTLLGGWGFLLGDEASGAWLGRHLLQKTLHVVDGLREATDLTRRVAAHFDGRPSSIVTFAASSRPGAFAEFAPWIIEAATEGDLVARDLVGEATAFIRKNIQRLGWQKGEAICALGGLAPHYRAFLPADLAADFVDPIGSALDGALILASRREAS